MAFGARQETDGKWRLCLRKGRTITGVTCSDGSWEELEFKGQRQAKACADELNEHYWETYRKLKPEVEPPTGFVDNMTNCIRKHKI